MNSKEFALTGHVQRRFDLVAREFSIDLKPYNTQPLRTMSDAFASITELCSDFLYDYFLVGYQPEIGAPTASSDVLLTNLPLYVVEDIVAMDWLADWSVIQHLQNTSAPFGWHYDKGIISAHHALNDTKTRKQTVEYQTDGLLIEEVDARFCQCIPLATKGQRRAFMTAFSSSPQVLELNPDFCLAFQQIFDQMESLVQLRNRDTSADLNPRELECLSWASAGKTSGEIATIITLSEHTVNHYLISCCKKLDCVNRTQAVAKAIRTGLIQ